VFQTEGIKKRKKKKKKTNTVESGGGGEKKTPIFWGLKQMSEEDIEKIFKSKMDFGLDKEACWDLCTASY